MYQADAIKILEKHYGDFDSALIFPLEVLLSGSARDDVGAIEFGFRKLEMCVRLLDIKPIQLADILTIN